MTRVPTEFPILRLRAANAGKRITGNRKPFFPKSLPYERQAERLGAVFDKAAFALEQVAKGVDVAIDPRSVAPDRCLVIEVIGPINDFNLAAQALGLLWLSVERPPQGDEDDDEAGAVDGIPKAHALYLTMPDMASLGRLLAQWRRFKANKGPDDGYKALWTLFGYLRDLRVWSPQDRLDPSVRAYVEKVLESGKDQEVLVELDFWYRTEKERRDRSLQTLAKLLQEVGGKLLDQIDIEEIQYQGALIQVPADVARDLAKGEGGIALLHEVMTIRPQASYIAESIEAAPELKEIPKSEPPNRRCVATILDGYPIKEHSALADRLHIHEVEVTDKQVPVSARRHGTAMASLVLHGDLHAEDGGPLDRPVAVIPVLNTQPGHLLETTPRGRLAIGVIYRALKAIVEATPQTNEHLASTVVVNHSICDVYTPFAGRPSPWSQMLDFFSHKHRLLFLVSAGNIRSPIPMQEYQDLAAFEAADPTERQAAILVAMERSKGLRGLLIPAESINAITVGALHADGAPPNPGAGIDPYPDLVMTNMASAVGLGTNRSIKPDLVAQGGRFLAACANVPGGGIQIHPNPSPHLGQLVASPSQIGDLRHVTRTAGTSNATALMARACHQIADAVEDTFQREERDWLAEPTRAVILKALLAHSCKWDATGRILDTAFPPTERANWQRRRDSITKFLGYGPVQRERVIQGDTNRVTLLGDGVIKPGRRQEYRLPIPRAMLNTKELRSITLTLAWTSPISTRTADYRGVVLKIVNSQGESKFWKGVDRVLQPNSYTAERGTLIHMVLEGEKKIKDLLSQHLTICVQASEAKEPFEQVEVPYALAITMEMAQSQQSQLYAQVREIVEQRARQAAPIRIETK